MREGEKGREWERGGGKCKRERRRRERLRRVKERERGGEGGRERGEG